MWLRNNTKAVNLETGLVVTLMPAASGRDWYEPPLVSVYNPRTGTDLSGPVRACDEGEIIAWCKAHVGDGQQELQP